MTPLEPTSGARGLDVSLLGSVRISLAGRDVPFPKRKSRALLGYLALTDGHQDTRERLGGLLWSEVAETRARTSLRQELHQIDEVLRRAGGQGLSRDRLRVSLLDPVETVDAQTILTLASQGQIDPRLVQEPLISDSFLRDVDDIDPAFAIWARARRQSFHDQLLVSLERVVHAADLERAQRRRCAQAILNLDPTHEEACRIFMRLSAEAGDPMAAQRAYNALYILLDRDYDSEPAPETIALVAEIKQGQIAPVPDPSEQHSREADKPVPARSSQSRRARITVLVEPFGINGIAPDSQHLVEGFRHELLASLVRFREWMVVAALHPPDAAGTTAEADAFAVAATAYRAGDVISMVLTLREQETGVHLWADRYTLTLDQWFDAQQDVIRKIANALKIEVSTARLRRIADQPDVSLAAYDLWLRGQAAMVRFDRERWEVARRMFVAAIEQGPDFARFHSGLAQIVFFSHLIHPGWSFTTAERQQSLSLASRAVELDAMDPNAQLTIGWALTLAGRFQNASVHLELARELNPNDTGVTISAAVCHALAGELEQAERAAEQMRGVTIAPTRLQWACQAMVGFLAGDNGRAVDAAERAQGVMLPVGAWHAAALAHAGRIDAARAEAGAFIKTVRAQWAAEEEPTLDAIGRWLLTMFAFGRAAEWTRLRDGLALAGIPDGGTSWRGTGA